jgi:polyhydroxybutyrate depolymerase
MKRATTWALMLVLCLTVAACQRTSAEPATSGVATNRTVTIDTKDGARTAIVVHPTTAPTNAPLVVMLHGGFGSAKQAEAKYHWDDEASRDGFVVAYPNGVKASWNAGRCCGQAQRNNVDDVGFLHALVAQLEQTDGVDPKRVYAVGMSNGAMMTYTWACRDPGELAGIGPVAGSLLTDCPNPHPITVVAIHGTADQNVPIDGGLGAKSRTGVDYLSLAQTLAPFIAADGCSTSPATQTTPPVEQSVWAGANGASVTTEVIQGAGHQWPGGVLPSAFGQKVLGLDPPSDAINATDFLWQHLRLQTL